LRKRLSDLDSVKVLRRVKVIEEEAR